MIKTFKRLSSTTGSLHETKTSQRPRRTVLQCKRYRSSADTNYLLSDPIERVLAIPRKRSTSILRSQHLTQYLRSIPLNPNIRRPNVYKRCQNGTSHLALVQTTLEEETKQLQPALLYSTLLHLNKVHASISLDRNNRLLKQNQVASFLLPGEVHTYGVS